MLARSNSIAPLSSPKNRRCTQLFLGPPPKTDGKFLTENANEKVGSKCDSDVTKDNKSEKRSRKKNKVTFTLSNNHYRGFHLITN